MRYHPKALTADGQAVTGKGILGGVLLQAGSDVATAAVYDGTNTSGRLLATVRCAANTTTSFALPGSDGASTQAGGTPFEVGLYLDLTGTSPTAIVYYAGQ